MSSITLKSAWKYKIDLINIFDEKKTIDINQVKDEEEKGCCGQLDIFIYYFKF